jgi:hypothetical protein
MFHIKNVFFNKYALTGGSATGDVIDTLAAKVGDVEPIVLEVWANEAATTSNSATLTITLQHSSDNSSFSDTVINTGELAASALAKGKVLEIPLPTNLKRYLRVNLAVKASTAFTAGKITAALRARY